MKRFEVAKWPQNGYIKNSSFEISILFLYNQLQLKDLTPEPAIEFEPDNLLITNLRVSASKNILNHERLKRPR
jgi:hypothetical protein